MQLHNDVSIPAQAGVGLKPQHFNDILQLPPDSDTVQWFEIHAENYMGAGGLMHHYLSQIRQRYPLSIHGVGLSLGSFELPCERHLKALKELINRYQPAMVSEHVSWSKHRDTSYNDLLPVPYTDESLDVFCRNIDKTQNALGQQILIENPSSYFLLKDSDYSEVDFINTIARRSGCKLLLDVNNVFVSAANHDFDGADYIESIDAALVEEIHLAGHSVQQLLSGQVRIDDHGSAVCQQVWDLYALTLRHVGNKPTLIEWDTDVPTWQVLNQQAQIANQQLKHNKELTNG